MSRIMGFRGVFAVDWSQVWLGDAQGLPPAMLAQGLSWRWEGQATKLDSGAAALWLDAAGQRVSLRARARQRAGRLAPVMPGTTMPGADTATGRHGNAPRPDKSDPVWPPGLAPLVADDLPAGSFSLTDGRGLYHARLIERGTSHLAVFWPFLPPAGHDLWVCAWQPPSQRPARRGGVICFLPGTLIDTPQGPRPVEMLDQGDPVLTRDNGVQPVIWRGETQLGGAELYLHPHLRPVRIAAGALAGLAADKGALPRADLLVSPGHRVLIRDPDALFGTGELLVAAADLEDGRRVRRDFAASRVTYVHLMLPGHEVISANGLPCESFHPALADPAVLDWHARSIERACPGLLADPQRLGPPARRCLTTPQAHILRHALAC